MSDFKVGDWIRELDPLPYVKTVYQLKQSDFFGVGRKSKEYFTNIELWQPKDGEWCWFQFAQPKTVNYQILSKFKLSSPCGRYYEDINGMCFDFCEPFIGELPSFLKDKR